MSLIKKELTTVFFIAFLSGTILVFMNQRNNPVDVHVFSAAMPPTPTAEPTVMPAPKTLETVFEAPDGKKFLTMQSQKFPDHTVYNFYTSDTKDSERILNFSKSEVLGQTLEVPFNAWSPNDSYFFIKEITASTTNFLLFYTSGKSFADGQLFLNITPLFQQAQPDYKISDITGWGGDYLLVVNTIDAGGATGPSFWFDVTSSGFIRLSTLFK